MNKLILSLLLLKGGIAFSQNKSDTTFTDTTKYISNRDINQYLSTIEDKVSVKQYNDFLAIMQGIIAISRKEWEQKKLKKP